MQAPDALSAIPLSPNEPRVGDLIAEFQRCGPVVGPWNRAQDNERTRFALWDNQTPDGKKNSVGDFEAKPWDGASDLRVFLADDIINEDVATLTTAFWRALVRVEGVEPDDAGAAAVLTRMLTWLCKTKLYTSLVREVELSAQYRQTYGWAAVHVTWRREIAMRNECLKLEDFTRVMPGLAAAIMDPERDDETIAMLQSVYDQVADLKAREIGIEDAPDLKRATLKKALGELRECGMTHLPVPYIARNEPEIFTLRPWQDIFVPDEIGDLQRGRCYVRNWFREEELRAKIRTDGWDEDWVDQAVKTRGQLSVWTRPGALLDGSQWSVITNSLSPWIEVVTCYSRRVDEDGVPAIYCTVFSPHVSKTIDAKADLVATHGILDYQHGEVPVPASPREWWCRSITAARGIPEMAAPEQRVSKVMQDSLIDRTSLTTLPPKLIPERLMDEDYEFGPASSVPMRRGEEPKFMQVPPNDGVAQAVLTWASAQVDQRFARLSPTVSPARVQTRQQHMVAGFLAMWTTAFKQVLALCLQYMAPSEFERITKVPKPKMAPDEIANLYDFILQVDVRELDVDYSLKQLEAVSKFVLPEDAAGVIDRSKLIREKLNAINPLLGQKLVSDVAGAQQKLFQDVSTQIASMFLGNPPQLVENDPTAPIQLQFAAQIVQSNPNYQQALMAKESRFSALMENWTKNRMQSQVQQQNKTVGRLGVAPVQG